MPGFSKLILEVWQGNENVSGIKRARVLNMLRYSYNNIIVIVTNVATLEFLSARFVHLSALELTILSFFDTS